MFVSVHVCVIFVCSFVSPVSSTQVGLSLVFGQVGLTIDWNWTSQARGVFSCTCTFCVCVCVCMCVCVCVCVCMCVSCVWSTVYVCICVFLTFLHVIKWGSMAQVSTSWTSLARRATVSVENMCFHLCALGVCEFVHVIALLVRGYMFCP